MLFSIIIPVYNARETILDTIKSIMKQTYDNFEIIVVDDGSTDDTYGLVETLSNSKILLLKQENKRQGAARNYGVSHSTGDFLLFVDADDSIDVDLLKTINDQLKTSDNRIDAVYYDIKRIYPAREQIIKFPIDIVNKVKNEDPTRVLGLATPCNAAFSREFLKRFKIQFVEQVYFEDISFMVDTLFYARTIEYVPNVYYHYNILEKSTVRSSDGAINLDVIENIEHFKDKLRTSHPDELTYLSQKYLIFEACLRILDSKDTYYVKKELIAKLRSYYLENVNLNFKNEYYQDSSKLFKLVVNLVINRHVFILSVLNKLRRLLNA